MKTLKILVIAVVLLLPLVPTELNAGSNSRAARKAPTEVPDSEKAKKLLLRLDEINAMDKSKLSAPEKKLLRNEVRSTKKQLNELGGGVYISVGAIIIILLLLIILF